MTSGQNRSSASLKWALAALLSAGFAFPLAALLWYRADPLTIAIESLAYPLLYAERLIHGEGATIWVLAGCLTTAIQISLLRVTNALQPYVRSDLMDRTHWFGYLYKGGIIGSGIAVFCRAAGGRRRAAADRLLLGLVALGPLYLMKTAGFYYYTLPDYYLLNILLTLFAVWLFQSHWNGTEPKGFDAGQALGIGLFVGSLCANKGTIVAVGAPVALVFLFRPGAGTRHVLAEAPLVAYATIGGFLLVLLWFYQFHSGAVRHMLKPWLKTIGNPGGEPDFWTVQFRNYLTGYSYAYIMACSSLALVFAVSGAILRPAKRWLTLGTAGYPRLGEEFHRPDAAHRDWTAAIEGGGVLIHGHAVRIGPAAPDWSSGGA